MIPTVYPLRTLSNTPAPAVVPNWHIWESQQQLLTRNINTALVAAHAGDSRTGTQQHWWHSHAGTFRVCISRRSRAGEAFHPHLGAIRLNNKWPAPEHTKCLWQSTELCSNVLWTRLMHFLVDCPSFNQLRHLSIESKWNEKQANAPSAFYLVTVVNN